MSEGKSLLNDAIDLKLKSIKNYHKKDYVIDNINIPSLIKKLDSSFLNFYLISDSLILFLCENEKFDKEEITKVRDLLVGMKYYNIKVDLDPKFIMVINEVNNYLKDVIERNNPGILSLDDDIKNSLELKRKINNNQIIDNFNFIEKIIKEYDNILFDNNMLKVMQFINDHNNKILLINNRMNIKYKKAINLSEDVIDILNKLKINYQNLPDEILYMINSKESLFIKNYQLIHKNKAEDGGILHLIKKDNSLDTLALLLFSDEETIKNVISTLYKGASLNVDALKSLVNNNLSSLISIDNIYYKSNYKNYLNLTLMLKTYNINYYRLIVIYPSFFSTSSNDLKTTLTFFSKLGIEEKVIINKYYKTLTLDPSLLVKNYNILASFNHDIKEMFMGDNYLLLKLSNLNEIIKYLINNNKINNNFTLNELYNELNTKYKNN